MKATLVLWVTPFLRPEMALLSLLLDESCVVYGLMFHQRLSDYRENTHYQRNQEVLNYMEDKLETTSGQVEEGV